MHAHIIDPRELSRFEYPDSPYCMYDPVLRLRVGCEPGPQSQEWYVVHIGIHHDPEIEQGRYVMPRKFESPEELEFWRNRPEFRQQVPFKSDRSQRLERLSCYAEDLGDRIRLKVAMRGSWLRSHAWRGRIESMNIPLVSNDVASMYMGVIKAYGGLPQLHMDNFFPDRFPHAQTLEICVTTSGLTEGLERSARDYPMVEAPIADTLRSVEPHSAAAELASMADEGWHGVASWPMRLESR